jgi:hypothetical protein
MSIMLKLEGFHGRVDRYAQPNLDGLHVLLQGWKIGCTPAPTTRTHENTSVND